jgi:hypothetical protein
MSRHTGEGEGSTEQCQKLTHGGGDGAFSAKKQSLII